MKHHPIRSRLVQASAVGIGALWLAKQLARRGRQFDLQGRTVLITGGSRGLGLALAREFAFHKARIAICARDQEELTAAERDIRGLGVDVRGFVCDLRDEARITSLIDEVESIFGKIDVLVNNAAIITVGPAQSMTIEDFQEAMNVNFWPTVHTTLCLAPRMRARGFGRIVNVGSIGGKTPVPHLAPYCASKFALVGFSGSMRSELMKDGILVTNVNPGLMRTGSPRNANFKGQHQAEYGWFSISDSLPGISISAASAAKRIVSATLNGDGEVTLGLPAKLASTSYGVAPDSHLTLMAWINRLLPKANNGDTDAKPGRQSESWITRSFVRGLGRYAEREYNQLGH